jgi:hypothetical protein
MYEYKAAENALVVGATTADGKLRVLGGDGQIQNAS